MATLGGRVFRCGVESVREFFTGGQAMVILALIAAYKLSDMTMEDGEPLYLDLVSADRNRRCQQNFRLFMTIIGAAIGGL
jgi:hypothetical protein